MKAGDEIIKKYDLSSLRYICSVGEPLNPEVIKWGLKVYNLPIHDNWWQTELGGPTVATHFSMPGKPGSAGVAMPGAVAAVVGLFYYLQVARAMFMKPARKDAPPIPQRLGLTFAIAVCLTGVIVLGLFPAILLDQAERAASTFVLGPRRIAAF